eukprot:TRINITY_DN8385_c0_g1_i3.p1 TRINITY_DN8385_c0_g1~~TRINITY_DN8385_c0_g1_i3.p1  ORF type:complete len:202 (+),score=29.00 TRINITY_DN8385_c0_g1_i3:54-659(+)
MNSRRLISIALFLLLACELNAFKTLKTISDTIKGMVRRDSQNGELVISGPLVSYERLKREKLEGNLDKNKGVWSGRIGLQNSGIRIELKPLTNSNIELVHSAFKVDGEAWEVDAIKQSYPWQPMPVIIKRMNSERQAKFSWKYEGPTKVSIQDVRRIVDNLNSNQVSYNLVLKNCQDLSSGLINYSRGLIDEAKFLSLIHI